MVVQSRVSEEAFRRVALRDPDGRWELHDGQLQEKPPMSGIVIVLAELFDE